MASYKAGLHKNISSIFDGAPLQRQSADSALKQTSLPDFVTEQTDGSEPRHLPQQPSQQQSYSQPTKPVQKLYKDTAEKTHKLISKMNSRKDTSFSKIYQAFRAKLLPQKSSVNQKRQIAALVLVPALCLVLIFILFKFVLPISTNREAVPKTQAAVNVALPPTKINWQIPKLYTALPRDPMRPSGPWQAGSDQQFISGGEIALTGIVYSEDNPTAVINEKIMHTGEKIGDISIIKIEKDSVTFERSGQTKTLKVGQSWLPVDQMK